MTKTLFLTVLAVLFLSEASFACAGTTHTCTASSLHIIDLDLETSVTDLDLTSSTDETACTFATTDFENLLVLNNLSVARENTFVAKKGLWGFFAGALKKVAVWGGVKLTKWVLSKINRRASTYTRYYNAGDSGVIKAAHHWDDLQSRSGCSGKEPDHNLTKPGFQDSDDCPICSKQVRDLKLT